MIKSLAKIEKINQNSLVVSSKQTSSCHACSSKDSCGVGILSKIMPNREHVFYVDKPKDQDIAFHIGDWIEIGLGDESLIKGALLLYIVPLLAMMLCVFLALFLGFSEGILILTALFGLVIGFVISHYQSKKMTQKIMYKPVFIQYIGKTIDTLCKTED